MAGRSRALHRRDADLGTIRGQEIGQWLYEHPEATSFAIVDDDSDMGTFMDRLIQTDGSKGLTNGDCGRLAALLAAEAV